MDKPETSIPRMVFSLVDDLPGSHVTHIADLLERETELDGHRLRHLLKAALPQFEVQERVRQFIREWEVLPQPPSPREMSQLLRATSNAIEMQCRKQKVELIWTGPKTSGVNLRRTDQALLELIHAARHRSSSSVLPFTRLAIS